VRGQVIVYKMNFLGNQCEWLYCDVCRMRHPLAPPIRVAKATRRRRVQVIKGFDLLPGLSIEEQEDDFIDGPHFPSTEKYKSAIGTIKLERSRVFQIVRDPRAIDEVALRADLAERRRDLSEAERDEEVRQLISILWSDPSDGRLGLVEVWDDRDGKCVVHCYRCDTEFPVDREEAAAVLGHVKSRGGIAYLTNKGIKVEKGKAERKDDR
jgi:hypothetical protein